jgi:hypothetical protein
MGNRADKERIRRERNKEERKQERKKASEKKEQNEREGATLFDHLVKKYSISFFLVRDAGEHGLLNHVRPEGKSVSPLSVVSPFGIFFLFIPIVSPLSAAG